MDKLKPILKYRFWILLAVAAIIPLVGWFYGRSGMMAEASQRTKDLNDTYGKLATSAEDPNADWERRLAEINQIQKAEYRKAWAALYGRQEKLMTWPKPVDPVKLEMDTERAEQLELYRTRYAPALEAVRQIVKPLDEYQEGLVDLSSDILPHPEIDWINERRAPRSSEVFAAQEDLWLLAGILKAIAEVNENSTSQVEAPIRHIVELLLRGGSVKGAAAAGPTTPGANEEGGAQSDISVRMMQMRRGGQDQDETYTPRVAGASSGFDNNVSFNPDDELGPEVAAVDPNQAAQGTNPTAGARGMVPMGGRGNTMDRSVRNEPEWKSRGFYLELVMDHRKVPDLLVSLSNADWPIRITRVHQADFKDEDLVPESAGGPFAQMPSASRGGGEEGGAYANAMRMRMMMSNNPNELIPGGRGGGRAGSRRAPAVVSPGASSALDDHMLANVALDGLITIFKQPPEEPTPVTSPLPELPASPAQAPAAAPGASAAQPPEASVPAAADAAEEAAPEKPESSP